MKYNLSISKVDRVIDFIYWRERKKDLKIQFGVNGKYIKIDQQYERERPLKIVRGQGKRYY